MNGGEITKKLYAIFACLLFVGTILTASAVVVAKRPENPGGGGGGGPTGTIFFNMYDNNDDLYIWTISPDGSGLTKQNLMVDGVQSLSWKTHNEHYWYVGLVAIDGETYNDGLPRQEIYAIRDDNNMGFFMTDDEDMAFAPTDPGEQLLWVPGDEYISWVGKVWTDQGGGTYAYDDYGIYRAEVEYDENGEVSGLGEPEFVYNTGFYYDKSDDTYVPDIYEYSWNPDGDQIAFNMHDGYIYIDSIHGDTPTQLTNGGQPKWSPDGTKIAFGRHQEILVINVDGTDETSLEKVKTSQGSFTGIHGHDWSPDSKYLLYTIWVIGRATWNKKTTMYTIEPDGSGRSSISGLSVSTWKSSRDWR